MDKKTKEAIEAGYKKSPLVEKIERKIERKEMIERAKKNFLKYKKKLYANEHPKYRSNNKQD